MKQFSLCWDCSKATGQCTWSKRLVPVKGWKATEIPPTKTKPYSAYIVEECPAFERDAYQNGTKRCPKE